MDKIVIKVSDLYQKAKELMDDKMDYAELNFIEADDVSPACVNIHATSKNDDYAITDYEEIEAVSSAISKEFD